MNADEFFGKVKSMQRNIADYVMLTSGRRIGFCIIVAMAVMALSAPYIAPCDPYSMDAPRFLNPSWEHPLGTDNLGQDIYSQLIYASRISLLIGVSAATIVIAIGFILGAVAGYKGGLTENAIMGATDFFLLLPALPLMVIVSSYLGAHVINTVLIIALLWWCGTTRVVQSKVVQIRSMSFMESTRAMGFSDSYIVKRHIFRNVKEILSAKWCISIVSAIMAEAGLAFLGLGDPINLSWGGMISQAFAKGGFSLNLWWWYIAPGIMISITAASFFLLASKAEKNVYREA